MRVGIIGAGNIGRAVATRLIDGDHTVTISNSRGPESLAELEQDLGQAASAATVEDAARAGEVVIVATPLAAVATLPSASPRRQDRCRREQLLPRTGRQDPRA